MAERERGFIVIHRRIESWPVYEAMNAEQRHVVTTQMLVARWQEEPGEFWFGPHRFEVPRGSYFMSEQELADRAGTSRKVVRTVYGKLLTEGYMSRRAVHESGQCPHLVTIVNYDKYQSLDDIEGLYRGQRRASDGPEAGPRRAPKEPDQPDQPGEPVQQQQPRWPLTERFRRRVSDALGGQQNGGKGLSPLQGAADRDEFEADLARVTVDAAVDASVEIARRNGRGRISALSYFRGIVHDLAVPPQARPESKSSRPTKSCPRCGRDRTGISEWASPDACTAGTCTPASGAKA